MFSYPWNQKTPIGYSAEIVVSTFTCETFFAAYTNLLLIVAVCLQLNACLKIFRTYTDKVGDGEHNDRIILYRLVRNRIVALE